MACSLAKSLSQLDHHSLKAVSNVGDAPRMVTIDHSYGYENGAVIHHPIIIIQGQLRQQLQDHIEVCNETTGATINWPVVSSKFKSFVVLSIGLNVIAVRHGFYTKSLQFTLQIPNSIYMVQPLYVIACDDDGTFQAPEGVDNSPLTACKKISLNTALLQTFTATNMRNHKLGSHTFRLPLDVISGLPKCAIFKSKYSRQQLYDMTEKELWRNLARDIMESNQISQKSHSKFLAFLSITQYDGTNWHSDWKHKDVIAATKGYIALGGGGLAVLGTGTLHTWAEDLRSLVTCFTDNTRVNGTRIMDDSAYRKTYWANYATGLGAALHELGHTFDLSHTDTGIMSRGFDNIHLFFVLHHAKSVEQRDDSENQRLHQLRKQLHAMTQEVAANTRRCSFDAVCTVVHDISFVPKSSSTQGALSSSAADCNAIRKLSQNDYTADIPASPVSPTAFPCFQLPLYTHSIHSEAAAIVKSDVTNSTGSISKITGGIDSITKNTDGVDDAAGDSPKYESASVWSSESAVMLRYSRWIMNHLDAVRSETRYAKPVIKSGSILMDAGISVLQIYLGCHDTIQSSFHYAASSDADLPTHKNLDDLRLDSLTHKPNCDKTTSCITLQIRDRNGKFYTLSPNV